MESRPPTTHTANTTSTVPTFWIMVLGTRKMPLPITVPTTMDAAAQAPRARFSSVRGAFSIVGLFLGIGMTGWQVRLSSGRFADADALERNRRTALEERGDQSHDEGGNGSDQHVPGPGDRSVKVDTDDHGQPCCNAGDGGAFARFAREHAEQEDAQQRSHRNR